MNRGGLLQGKVADLLQNEETGRLRGLDKWQWRYPKN